MVSKTYTTRPAGPAIPVTPTKVFPENYWPGEEKFRFWHVPEIAYRHRLRGCVREFIVFGVRGWRDGPRTSRLHLSRHFDLLLFVNEDKKMTVEAEVLLTSVSARIAKMDQPERGAVVSFKLSTEEEDREVRLQRRNMLRLASWTANRLGPAFEEFLADQGL
ncbi:hypothetical protein BJF92_13640 [Rhizobium rhizosphaerae]|uniref:Uncharacterized protein n=1 Tax=Xaviernesmea rhizosphaerae TaxID=1672749 RepID=A0A1Q9AI02_9HYPH|nr:hypothetical protein [Xaviernesmea rhizosphaerae]OLP54847.1 hypothetical protein BJF92_13640 [Xaviernesmea rhizosphaerae]